MNNKVLNEAVENISLIKGLIERTSKSFASFSKLFIYWGILFIFNSIVQLMIFANFEKTMAIYEFSPLLSYVFPMGIVALIAAIIYKVVSKKNPLIGLEKHLMILWLLILVMNIIPGKTIIDTPDYAGTLQRIIVHTNTLSTSLFSLALGLIITSLFTGFKQLKTLGIIYIIISVLNSMTNIQAFSSDSFVQVIQAISLPFTFLYTGFYLKSRQVRGD